MAERGHLQRFVCEQPQYSIFARTAEVAVLSTCQRHDMAVIPWSPLAGGWLTGKYRRGAEVPPGSRSRRVRCGDAARAPRSRPARIRELSWSSASVVADAAGLSLTELSLAFVARHPAVTSTIIGPKRLEQAEELLAAADVQLDDDTLDAIDQIVTPGTDAPGIDHFVDNPALAVGARRR